MNLCQLLQHPLGHFKIEKLFCFFELYAKIEKQFKQSGFGDGVIATMSHCMPRRICVSRADPAPGALEARGARRRVQGDGEARRQRADVQDGDAQRAVHAHEQSTSTRGSS